MIIDILIILAFACGAFVGFIFGMVATIEKILPSDEEKKAHFHDKQ